jgi:hypothetical protein
MRKNPSDGQARCWMMLGIGAGASMLLLFRDGCQQDAALHFLYSRWAWRHPEMFVDVWCRPLFTFLYAFPALIGYQTARLLTLAISVIVAWQTWELARELRLARAPLAIAFVWLQPSFFLFAAETMTEPVFALLYVIALRLLYRGWERTSMIVASLLILARPEGFFLGALWAAWILQQRWRRKFEPRRNEEHEEQLSFFSSCSSFLRGFSSWVDIALLATGAILWWLAAWWITGDVMFIRHNWPRDWPLVGAIYGAAGLLAYPARLAEIVGLWLIPPFLAGLWRLVKRRELGPMTSSFLLIFLLHTVLRAYGMLGSAGYPRYCITIAPAIALITLAGWNRLAELFAHVATPVRIGCTAVILAASLHFNFIYSDANESSRDARAIDAVHQWFREHPQPIARFLWSQPYAGIAFDRDPREQILFTRDRARDHELLRSLPPGTLVCWDSKVGPKWTGLEAQDFRDTGFMELHSHSKILRGYLLKRSWFRFGGPRSQTMYLFYKN